MPGGYSDGYSDGYGPLSSSGLVSLAADLADLLEAVLTVDTVAVTPGEPAASDDCSAVYVWADRIFDSVLPNTDRGVDAAGCFYRRTYELRYRIDTCLTVNPDGSELTPPVALEHTTLLLDLADTAWCEITHAASAGTLFTDVNTCDEMSIGALVIAPIQGDRASAQGSLRVSLPCPPPN